MNVLGVILARSGSVGLPSKHLLPLLGRPVIDYTLDHALASTRLTRVVLSTDCPEVRRLALRRNVECIHRPAHLATSDSSVQSVMLHAMHAVETASAFRADALVVLYGNVPVRPERVIDQAVEALDMTGCDSVRSFCPVGKWHPFWMSKLEGGRVIPLHEGSIHRRQDLTPVFLHDGAAVAVSRESMLLGQTNPQDPHAFFGRDRRGIQVPMGDTVEIDHRRDLYWAEAVLRDRQGGSAAVSTQQPAPMKVAV